MNAPALVNRLFSWKVRGIRWVEIIGVLMVGAMVFSVYVAKAGAAREGSRIAELERQIADNGQRVRLLRAEVARLEQPGRLEALSRGAGLAPVDVKRQATEASLPELVPLPEPVEIQPAAPLRNDVVTPEADASVDSGVAAPVPAEEAAR